MLLRTRASIAGDFAQVNAVLQQGLASPEHRAFIEHLQKEGAGIWQSFQLTPQYKAWSGYSFESICLKHLPQIKKALGISGVFSTSSSFYHKGAEGMDGCQIDLLIDRDDKVINLCEIKWANTEFIITKSYAAELRQKIVAKGNFSLVGFNNLI